MVKRKFSISLLILLSTCLSMSACSCFYQNFCESYRNFQDNTDFEYLLAFAQKEDNSSLGMILEISQVIEGIAEETSIDINLYKGTSCEMNSDRYPEGQTFLFLISVHRDNGEISFSLSPCSEHALKLDGDILSGDITESVSSIAIDELETLGNCPDVIAPKEQNLQVYVNNPFSGNLQLRFVDNPGNIFLYKIYDLTGRLVRKEVLFVNSSVPLVEIDTGNLPNGMYILDLVSTTGRKTLKIVKASS